MAPALGYDPDLHSIYDTLRTEPTLFVELVKLQFGRVEEEEQTDEQR